MDYENTNIKKKMQGKGWVLKNSWHSFIHVALKKQPSFLHTSTNISLARKKWEHIIGNTRKAQGHSNRETRKRWDQLLNGTWCLGWLSEHISGHFSQNEINLCSHVWGQWQLLKRSSLCKDQKQTNKGKIGSLLCFCQINRANYILKPNKAGSSSALSRRA